MLDPLEHEIAERLAAAGDRARSYHLTGPDRAFSADLRERLLTAAGDREAVADGDRESRVRAAWSLPSFFRVPRLITVAAAALLLIVGVVAARELYVAIGNRQEATPTPAPSVSAVVPPESASQAPASGAPATEPSAEAAPAHATETTAKPTAKPTANPTAAPTPGIEVMTLTATGCDGGIVLDWSAYGGDWFNHYTTLRSTTDSIPMAYPPQGGAVDPGGTYTANRGKTSAFDAGAAPGTTYYYRAMAFKADDTVIGASSVVSAVAGPVASLGSLIVAPDAVEGTDLTWTQYSGSGDCFTWYKLVYSTTDSSPSYFNGATLLTALPSQATGSYTAAPGDIPSGVAHFRVQVICATDQGLFLVGQSDVTTYNVPP